jgi:predicted N-acetyltransferase YhbS
MLFDIKIRDEINSDHDQRELILDQCFGKDRHDRTVYLYRKSLPIKELSFISYIKEPEIVIGTIRFYRVFISDIDCLLLGPLAVNKEYQGKGFGKALIRKGLDLAKKRNEKICFVSGEYNYYKHFEFKKISSKNLNIIIPGPLSFNDLLICELSQRGADSLQSGSELLPLN